MERVIYVGKKFTLGFCACGCGREIALRDKDHSILRRYVHGHHKSNLGKRKYCLLDLPKLCECGCGETIQTYFSYGINKGKIRHFKYSHSNPKGSESPYWKGGYIDNKGYVRIKINGKSVKEHRYIYEQYYNCSLLSWSDIHHINKIKNDNRIENLEPIMKSQHSHLHHPKQKLDRMCYYCGSRKTYYDKTLNVDKWFFSKDRERAVCQKCRDYRRYRKLNL